ncbi:ABC transporter substrate-binding protein [Lichenifustis flavocetrariae]|uniref:ABC transporter substrate-binding protein n=1 Tax=Lichenifustis flavocetrariae TaxID=2949735 RepID=A0AA41Z714_9HYPH|nr:ABC transporter substrate-binding protein [Lichenifustis flavocetrariae]MCW6511678.1 ABC transporter substrate-binding protein [Lichenifustis flavocetrariae]
MTRISNRYSHLRGRLGALENDLVDELESGRIDRRVFLRHGSMLGLSVPLLGGMAASAGLVAAPTPARAQAKPGATIRVASVTPAGVIDPVSIADQGGLTLLIQTGEFLCVTQPDLTLKPCLATSWSHNEDSSVWTFKLRSGVKYHTGETFKAEDVIASIDRLCDPKNASNALSAFKGILSKGNIKKVDDLTVEFHLDAPYGAFPYVVSSDNYNCVMLPVEYKGDYEKNWTGTGPFRLDKFTQKQGVSFVRFDGYWGEKALPDRTEFVFYDDLAPRVLALQGGQVDMIDQVPVAGGQALLNDPQFTVIREKSAAHEQVHMRCDTGPFTDKRVRRAMALSIEREKLVQGLFRGYAVTGNDSPFAPAFPSTDTSVPQRKQDIAQAKQLLEAAGVAKGFDVTLTTERYIEIPQYAILLQNFARPLGINIKLNVEAQDAYYGKAVFGQSDWLDSTMGITDYGQRGVPNVYLRAPLLSDGTWNGAHFKNPQYDKLVGEFGKAGDLGGQRTLARQIQELLLDETPIIFAYFYDYLVVTKKALVGIPPIANRLFLDRAGFA